MGYSSRLCGTVLVVRGVSPIPGGWPASAPRDSELGGGGGELSTVDKEILSRRLV